MANNTCSIGYDAPGNLSELNLPVEHLKIGECIFTRRRCIITTVLGSCVSVTFHHPPTGTGGVFHAMLPEGKNTRCDEDPCKFADTAIRCILAKMDALEIPRNEIVCKLFGGGFTVSRGAKLAVRNIVDVGKKNVRVAKEELKRQKLRLSCENTRGEFGRKLYFVTTTGQVWMKNISEDSVEPLCY